MQNTVRYGHKLHLFFLKDFESVAFFLLLSAVSTVSLFFLSPFVAGKTLVAHSQLVITLLVTLSRNLHSAGCKLFWPALSSWLSWMWVPSVALQRLDLQTWNFYESEFLNLLCWGHPVCSLNLAGPAAGGAPLTSFCQTAGQAQRCTVSPLVAGFVKKNACLTIMQESWTNES